MTRWIGVALLLGAAVSLTAAQLSIGTVANGPGQTATVSVVLASGGGAAGVQFDLSYDRTALTVSVALGSAAGAAQKNISLNDLGNAQRAIVVGGRTPIADGVVATVTITVAANAPLGSRALTLTNVVATDANANSIPLTIVNGANNVNPTYLVGDVYPYTTNTAPQFGTGALNILDMIQVLFAVDNIPGFAPAACSDRFDAMDSYPADTATARGGDGVLDIRDLIVELFRVNNLDPSRPIRTSLEGCAATGSTGQTAQSAVRISRTPSKPPAEIRGTLVLGSPEKSPTQERVPVYLQAGRDLVRTAVTFGLGDQQSPLHFVNAAPAAPSLMQDSQPGAVALAWLDGLSVGAGERLLLGYVTGPLGFSANLKVFGWSASGLNDNQEVGLDVSGGTRLR